MTLNHPGTCQKQVANHSEQQTNLSAVCPVLLVGHKSTVKDLALVLIDSGNKVLW